MDYATWQDLRREGWTDSQIKSQMDEFGDTYVEEAPKAPTKDLWGGSFGDVVRAGGRGVEDVLNQGRYLAKGLGAEKISGIIGAGADYLHNSPQLTEESQESIAARQANPLNPLAIAENVAQGVTSFAPIMAAQGSEAVSAASTALGNPFGIGGAAVIHGATTAAFAVEATQRAYDEMDRRTPWATEEEKERHAATIGGITGAAMGIGGGIIGGATNKLFPAAKNAMIAEAASGKSLGQIIKGMFSAGGQGAALMAGQEALIGLENERAGQGEMPSAKQFAANAISNTIAFGAMGYIGVSKDSARAQAIGDALTNPEVPVEQRLTAAQMVYDDVSKKDPELANLFRDHVVPKIANNEPIGVLPDTEYKKPAVADIGASQSVDEAVDAFERSVDSVSLKPGLVMSGIEGFKPIDEGEAQRTIDDLRGSEPALSAGDTAAQLMLDQYQPEALGYSKEHTLQQQEEARAKNEAAFNAYQPDVPTEVTPQQQYEAYNPTPPVTELQLSRDAAAAEWDAQTEAALAANRRANEPRLVAQPIKLADRIQAERARRDAEIKAEQDRLMSETPESVPPLSPEQQFEQESLAYRQRQNTPKPASEASSDMPAQPVKLADRIQAERAKRAAAEIEAGMKSAPESEPPATKDPELLNIERVKAKSLAYNREANTRQQTDLMGRMTEGAVENDTNAMIDRANLRKNREMDRLVEGTERENNEREWRANGWMSPTESLREDARLSVAHRKEAEAAVALDPIRKLGAEMSRAKINVKQFDKDYPGARAEITKTFPTMFTKKGGTTIDTFAGRADHPEFADGESIVQALRKVQPRNAAIDKYIADNPMVKPHREVNALVEDGFRLPEKTDHKWGDFEAGDSLTAGGEQYDVVGKTPDGVEVQVGNRFETRPVDEEVRPEYVKKFDPTAEKPMPEDWLTDELKPTESEKDAESLREDAGRVQESGDERESGQDQGGEDLQRESEAQPSAGDESREAEGDRGPTVEDIPFAKAESDNAIGLTHDDIHAEGRESLGQGYDRLRKAGKLEVVDTLGDKMPDGSTPIKDDNMRAVGFYYKGKITLIADSIRAGEVDGILRHEGLHLLMREDKSFMRAKADILADFKALRETSAAVKAAYDKVPESTPSRLVDEEALAYFASEHGNAKHGIVRRMITAVKMWLMKHGLPTGRFSTDDMLGMIDRGLRKAGETSRDDGEGPLYDKRPEVTVESLDKEKEDAKGFIKRDLAPAAKTVFTGLDDARKGVIKLFAAGNLNADSRLAADTMIEHMGAAKGEKARYENSINEISKKYSKNTGVAAKLLDEMQTSAGLLADKKISKMSTKELVDMLQAWDTTGKHEDPEIQAWMATTQEMFDAKRDAIREIDPHLLEMVRESYLPHILASKTDVPAAAIALAKVPIEGSKNFTHKRVFDDIEALHKAGFKLESYNPFDLVALKMAEMDKFIIAHSTAKELAANESVNFHMIPASEKTPAGLVDVGSKYMTVTKDVPSTKREFINSLIGQRMSKDEAYAYAAKTHANGEPYTKPEKYRYVASPEIGHVFKNYMSSTLYNNEYGGSLFKAYMGIGHTMNSFQLLSGFHVGVVSTEAVVAKLGSGIADILNGEVSRGAKGILSSPAAPFTTFMSGDKAFQAYLSKTPAPEMAHIVKWLELAGAQKGMDKRFQGSTTSNMLQEWANGNKIGAAIRAPFAAVEQLTRPITEYLVPRMKFGAFVHQMERWTADHPNATHEELRSASQAAWDHTEALLGQVAYDRIFMHNAAKNAIQATIRAPGWTGGTLVLFGKAAKDTATMAKNLAIGKAPGKVSASQGHVIGLAVFAAVVNGLMTKILTGEDPKGMDFLAFRDGGVDKNGAATRYVLPTYMRDAFSYSQDWVKTLSNKTNPAIGLVSDIVKNRDFYGTEIRGRDDKAMKQISDVVGYAVKQFTPFSIRAVQESNKRGTSSFGKTLAAQVGITPASSEYTKTPLMKFIQEEYVRDARINTRTHAQAEKSELVRDLTTRLRNHDTTALADMQEARRNKKLSLRDTTTIQQNSRLTPLQISFKKLSLAAAEKAYALATAKEKLELNQIMREKRRHG